MSEMSLQEQFELPLVKDLISQNDNLRIEANLDGTKLPDKLIENLKVPHVIKDKLLMKEGEFNGIFYPKEEILAKINDANEKGLILDHMDTQQQGTSNWAGRVENVLWKDGDQGEGMYGDLIIIDKPTAQKLASGAKFGISPTIDFEKNEVNGKIIGTDLLWKSFSFVVTPAVRDTMLNNKKGENMAELEDKKKKKFPYKYPAESQDEKKKIKEEEMSLEVEDNVLHALQAKDAEIAELRKFKEKIDNAKKTDLVANLTSNEFLIGRLNEDELADREKALMEKSPEVLSELVDIVGDHAELSAYTAFIKKYLKDNKGSSVKDAATAWKKKKPKEKEELNKEETTETTETDEATETTNDEKETASLTTQNTDTNKDTAELTKSNLPISEADHAMHDFMASSGGLR